MSDVSELSSTNTENMNTLLEEVSIFTLGSDIDSDSHEELGVKAVNGEQ